MDALMAAGIHAPSSGPGTFALSLGVAVALGGAVGLERELTGQPAGLRTHISLALGAALFGILSSRGFDAFVVPGTSSVNVDVSRVAAQIVSGIGFLGAGAIIKDGKRIRGLTTAASLWVTAAIGLAAGLGGYVAAVLCTAFLLLSLVGLRGPSRWLARLPHGSRRRNDGRQAEQVGRHAEQAGPDAEQAGPGERRSEPAPAPVASAPDRAPVASAPDPAWLVAAREPGEALGIDIGGSGIKGAPVDLATGLLRTDRLRVPTPRKGDAERMARSVAYLVEQFRWDGPVGVAFPGRVAGGRLEVAPNLGEDWEGVDLGRAFGEACGRPVTIVNDADAAGVAEVVHGAARGQDGLVVMVTIGTGVGTSVFHHGRLVPNAELADLRFGGFAAEELVSNKARKERDMSWAEWADALNRLLGRIEALVGPELIVIGGGVSRKHARFLPLLRTQAEVVPAALRNDAGIVGAALGSRLFSSDAALATGSVDAA